MILPGRATGSANFKPASGRRAEAGAFLARSASGARSPLLRRRNSPRSAGTLRIHRLQIDDAVALDNAEMQIVIRFKRDDLHEHPCLAVPRGKSLSAGKARCERLGQIFDCRLAGQA